MKVNEIGKQWGVAGYEYGISNLDLSRCEDETQFIKCLTWGEIKKAADLKPVAEEIQKNGISGIEDVNNVDIYAATGDGEEYNIYVPEWWD